MVSARVERTYPVDVATMWSLWTQPEHLARWFRPSLAEYGPTVATMDLRPGGAYRIEMVHSSGAVHAVSGVVVASEEPVRLALTWRWDGGDNESLVEVTFSAAGDGRTRVLVVHDRLLDADDAARHSQGWVACLTSLQESTGTRTTGEGT